MPNPESTNDRATRVLLASLPVEIVALLVEPQIDTDDMYFRLTAMAVAIVLTSGFHQVLEAQMQEDTSKILTENKVIRTAIAAFIGGISGVLIEGSNGEE